MPMLDPRQRFDSDNGRVAHRCGSHIDRRNRGVRSREQLRDRKAVIGDGEADHQREPKPEAVQRRRAASSA